MFKKLPKLSLLFDATEFVAYFGDLVFSESESDSDDDESDDDESDDDEYNLIVIFRH